MYELELPKYIWNFDIPEDYYFLFHITDFVSSFYTKEIYYGEANVLMMKINRLLKEEYQTKPFLIYPFDFNKGYSPPYSRPLFSYDSNNKKLQFNDLGIKSWK